MRELSCPICDADIPLDGDEKPGEEVYCIYCQAPLTLKGEKQEGWELTDEL